MIVKTSQRSGAVWLAAHLTRTDTNEAVRIVDGRGVIALDVHVALRQFEAQWRLSGSRARDYLVHAAISPARPLSEAQWVEAWEIYEQQHVLFGQPYIEVEHVKPGDTVRPSHRHRAYLRIRPDGRAVHLGHSFRTNEVVARLCELRFEHAVTAGAHNRAIVHYLERHGYGEDADRLRHLTGQRRQRASRSEAEAQQESRTGRRKAAAAERAAAAWRRADGPQARRAALADAGFGLARGDRRETVLAVGASGESWALHRLLAAGEGSAWTAARVRSELVGVLDALPNLEELRRGRRAAAVQEPPQPCGDETGRPLAAPVAARPDDVAPAASNPTTTEEEDAYWLTDPDDFLPAPPAPPAPIVCRLGAGASAPVQPNTARPGGGDELEDADGPPTATPQAAAAAPAASQAIGAAARTPLEGRYGRTPGASPPPPPARLEPVASGRRAPTAAEGGQPPTAPPSGAEAPRTMPAPGRNGSALPAGREGERTGAAHGSPVRAPTDGRGSGCSPAALGARREHPQPSASEGPEGNRERDRGQPRPPHAAPQEQARRRGTAGDPSAARRVQEPTTPDATVVAPPPVVRPPAALDPDIADRLRTYVGALHDWWGARRGRADGGIGDTLRRLDEAWRALVAATRLWLRRQRRSCAVEDVCDVLSQTIARNHAEASEAHDRWLDRAYQPAAVRVHGAGQASLPAQRRERPCRARRRASRTVCSGRINLFRSERRHFFSVSRDAPK